MSILYEGSNDPTTYPDDAPALTEQHLQTNSLQGGISLHGVHLLEKLTYFNRECTPGYVVHTKDTGAFGELIVTKDVSKCIKAIVSRPDTVTPMLTRLSTVIGEQSPPDGQCDVYSFSLKSYTEKGNFDIVGNNTPMFFVRDGTRSPDFIHSQKRLPGTDLHDVNMQWDFQTASPESAHQVTYLMGGRDIPKDFRHTDNFDSHIYQWINAEDERFWIKYHFETRQGWDFLTDGKAAELTGENTDRVRRDLSEVIGRGDYPAWNVEAQVISYDEATSYKVNPFDLTKTWPQKSCLLIPIGYSTLNRSPSNFFAKVKQAVLVPLDTVPGVDFSLDKMLPVRAFSYADVHRYRLGVNHDRLPVDRPRYPVSSFSQGGYGTYHYVDPDLPVHGSSATGRGPEASAAAVAKTAGCPVHSGCVSQVDADTSDQWESVDGEFHAEAYIQRPKDGNFSQAGDLIRNVMDDAERDRLTDSTVNAIQGTFPKVEQYVYQYRTSVNSWFGAEMEERFKTMK